jgi:tetratricopeptide (TPR) repeat protein
VYSKIKHGIAVGAYILCTVIIFQQPLVGSFGYEFAAVFALIASLIAGLYGIQDERKKSETPPQIRYRKGLAYNIAYLALPIILVFAVALPRLPCDPVEGLAFYALLPGVSVLYSYTLGWFLSLVIKRARILFVLIVIGSLAFSILMTILQPRIFFYNPFLGFFPGLSYDHLMPVTNTLVLYRGYILLLTVLFFTMLYILGFQSIRHLSFTERYKEFRKAYARSYLSIFVTACLLVVFIQFLSRGTLGFSTSRGLLEYRLGSVYKTQSVEIRYSSESFSDSAIAWVALEHEFRRQQAARSLGVQQAGTIRSYLYPSEDMKRELIGPSVTNIAKPWNRELHLNASSYDAVLLHELAHVIAREFGMPLLGISNSTVMMEGLAMAVDGARGNRTLHEHAAAIIQFGIVTSPSAIISNRGFALQASSLSYVLAGSFIQFLIDRYGMHMLYEAYPWSDFEKAYGRSADQLIREWLEYLRRIQVSERQRLKTRIHFERPSLFTIDCPRAIARLNRDGGKLLNRREYQSAREIFERAWNRVPNAASLDGMIISAYRAGDYPFVLNTLHDNELTEKFPQVIPTLLRVTGDIFVTQGKYNNARVYYTRLAEIDLTDALTEFALIRLRALESTDNHTLWEYLLDPREEGDRARLDLSVSEMDDDDAAAVLWARAFAHYQENQYDRASQDYRSLEEIYPDEFIRYRAALRNGEALFYQGSFQEAVSEFWTAQNYATNPSAVLYLNDWIDRALYAEEFGILTWGETPPWSH